METSYHHFIVIDIIVFMQEVDADNIFESVLANHAPEDADCIFTTLQSLPCYVKVIKICKRVGVVLAE